MLRRLESSNVAVAWLPRYWKFVSLLYFPVWHEEESDATPTEKETRRMMMVSASSRL